MENKTREQCIDIIKNLYGFGYYFIPVSYKENFNDYTLEELKQICETQLKMEGEE